MSAAGETEFDGMSLGDLQTELTKAETRVLGLKKAIDKKKEKAKKFLTKETLGALQELAKIGVIPPIDLSL